MKNKNILSKLSSGKGFYITAAVSFILVVAAIALVYRTSTGMLKDILTTLPEEPTAQQVRHNETDETDPRAEEEEDTTVITTQATTEEEPETSMAWVNRDDSKIPSTTEVTQAAISNDSYVFPAGRTIQKAYFPTSPVYDETMGDWRVHKGIDFSLENGAEVKSAGDGRVTRVISDPGWGYIIEIDHGDFTARYCGLEQGSTVKTGDMLEKGDTVGKLGVIPCEGEQESHLHFEAFKNSKNVDPMSVLKTDEQK